jgi:subtilisin family serine protease
MALVTPTALAAQEEPAAPAARPTPPTVFSTDQVIVEWAPGANHAARMDARNDAEVDFASDLGNRNFELVEIQPGQTANDAIRELRADSAVTVAERDSYSAPNGIPNDPLFGQLWGLRNTGLGIAGFSGAVAGDDIDATVAWDRAVGTPSTVIADIDTGYRFEHPDLASVAWTNTGEVVDGIDNDGNGIADDIHGADFVGANGEAPTTDGDPTDEDLLSGGHGVHTAGTMGAAGNNGIGISGVARNVRIMPLRVCSRFPSLEETRCPTSSQIAAINYAGAKGARAANMSLGGTSSSQAVVNAIAAAKETLFVISAGNDAVNNDTIHHYPCDYTPQTQASPPVAGAVDNIVCVAATDQADGLAGFSDWGPTSVDLGAPGTEILSTYPYSTPLEDTFTVNDFVSKWPATGANGGFQRTNESPLTSFGMTDVIGAPTASTVRETTSAAFNLPANGDCRLNQTRRVVLSGTDQYRYSVLLNGVEQTAFTPGATPEPGLERRFLELPAAFKAGGSVQVRFRFTTGLAPAAGDGVWLDDISVVCAEAVGQASSYGFLQGTSMAAPHVTGAAGLLFSMKPSATVTEVKNALLSSVDPVASLAGKTTSGGRLNVAAALDDLVPPGTETAAPDTAITSGPEGSTSDTGASLGFARTDADAAAFECRLDASSEWSACTSPASYTVLPGPHTFEVRAKVPPSGLADPTPASRSWTVVSPPQASSPLPSPGPSPPPPPPLSCTVPKLAGKTLGQAKAALTAAHCKLGKVSSQKAKHGHKPPPLIVKSSTPAAGSKPANGTVNLTLGPKPKPRKHHHHR